MNIVMCMLQNNYWCLNVKNMLTDRKINNICDSDGNIIAFVD